MPGGWVLACSTGVLVSDVVAVGPAIVVVVVGLLGFGLASSVAGAAFAVLGQSCSEFLQLFANVRIFLVAFMLCSIHVLREWRWVVWLLVLHMVGLKWLSSDWRAKGRGHWWYRWCLLHHQVHLGSELLDAALAFAVHAFKLDCLALGDVVGCLICCIGIGSGILLGTGASVGEVDLEVGPSVLGWLGSDAVGPFVACAVEVTCLTEVAKGHGHQVLVGDGVSATCGIQLVVL